MQGLDINNRDFTSCKNSKTEKQAQQPTTLQAVQPKISKKSQKKEKIWTKNKNKLSNLSKI